MKIGKNYRLTFGWVKHCVYQLVNAVEEMQPIDVEIIQILKFEVGTKGAQMIMGYSHGPDQGRHK